MSGPAMHLARPEVLRMQAYLSARSIAAANDALRLLDANEAPEPFDADGPPIHRYPSQQPQLLVERLANLYGLPAENLLVTRGSDEAIDLVIRAFCAAGQDAIGICPPTYGMYAIAAELQGAAIRTAPLTQEFALDAAALEGILQPSTTSAAAPRLKVLFLCSPGNPTGTTYDIETLERTLRAVGDRCVTVIDEAYAEFSHETSALTLLPRHPNLVVLRTLSKAWALAGVRVGALAAHPELVSLLRKVLAPYPLPAPAIEAALRGTADNAAAAMRSRVEAIRQERAALTASLLALSPKLSVVPSGTNFLLVRCTAPDSAALVLQRARARGLLLRDRSREPGLAGCIRVTIGTPADQRAVFESFREALS